MVRIAHLSDLHVTPVTPRLRDLNGKRLLGWLSWRRRRRHEHRPEVLEALIRDLSVEHVAVPGALTNVGLPSEIAGARDWLARIGPPLRVSVVPGNHDAYAGDSRPEERWRAYMGEVATWPYVRRLPGVAIVGLRSARPTAPLLATGRLGRGQLARLDSTLAELAREGLSRILLIHHPPLPAGQSRRRQLDDSEALREVIARRGAELVAHGHTHRTHVARLEGPGGRKIPVIGVPSATSASGRPERRARYHVYTCEGAGADVQIRCQVRRLDASGTRFEDAGPLTL